MSSGDWSAVGFQFSSWQPMARRAIKKYPTMVPKAPKMKQKDPESDSLDDPTGPVDDENLREKIAFRRYVQRIRSSHKTRRDPPYSARLHSDGRSPRGGFASPQKQALHGGSPLNSLNDGMVQELATSYRTPRHDGASSTWAHSPARFPLKPTEVPPVGQYSPVFEFVLPRTRSASLAQRGRDTYSPVQSPWGTRSRSSSPPEGSEEKNARTTERLKRQEKASATPKKACSVWDKTSPRKVAYQSCWQPADPYTPHLLSNTRKPVSFSFGRAVRNERKANASSTLSYRVIIRSKSPCADFSKTVERAENFQRQGFWEKREAKSRPDRLAEHNDHDCVRVRNPKPVDYSKALGRKSLFPTAEVVQRPVSAPGQYRRELSTHKPAVEVEAVKRAADTWFAFRKTAAPAINCAKSPQTKHAHMKQLPRVRNHHDQVLFECEMLSEWFDWRRNLERNPNNEAPTAQEPSDGQLPVAHQKKKFGRDEQQKTLTDK